MKSQLKKQIEKAKSYIIVVEGKKDKKALQDLGFKNIFIIHETGKPLYWKIEKIAENCDKKEKVCILTDFDKEGKKLYFLLKEKFQELGIKQDNSLRGALLKEKISHIEGLSTYLKNHK
jgi:5S rRNA maturation endonuclease (ribonuclease M5)